MRAVLEAGLQQGRNPRALATDIVGRVNPVSGRREGGIIGLTAAQTDYVIAARAELASGNPDMMRHYLTRQRRDRRFDRMVMQAIRDGRRLSVADVDRATGRYRDRLLDLRATNVARTESITALRAGRHEGFAQLVDTGAVRTDQIERTWDATGDIRTRPDHMAMEGQKVIGLDAPFIAPDGTQLMFPGDTSRGASGKHTINCRCFEKVRVRYLK